MNVSAGLWYTLAREPISLSNSSSMAGGTVVRGREIGGRCVITTDFAKYISHEGRRMGVKEHTRAAPVSVDNSLQYIYARSRTSGESHLVARSSVRCRSACVWSGRLRKDLTTAVSVWSSTCLLISTQSKYFQSAGKQHMEGEYRTYGVCIIPKRIHKYCKQVDSIVDLLCILANDPDKRGFRLRFVQLFEVGTESRDDAFVC